MQRVRPEPPDPKVFKDRRVLQDPKEQLEPQDQPALKDRREPLALKEQLDNKA